MHKPSHYREAFEDAVLAFLEWEDGAPEPTVSLGDAPIALSRICGLMCNCSDILPSRLADSVEECEPPTSPTWSAPARRNTYGAAARLLRSRIHA